MNNEFNKEIIRLGFCLFLCSLSYSLSLLRLFFSEEHYIHLQILLFDSLVVISFILFFYLLEKTNLYFFSLFIIIFHWVSKRNMEEKCFSEYCSWIVACLFSMVFTSHSWLLKNNFFFLKWKIFFFYFKQKIIIIILSSFLSIHTLTPSHSSITQTLFS